MDVLGSVLQGIAGVLPLAALVVSFIGGVGGLWSVLITEGAKADHQRDLERLKGDVARDTEAFRAQLSAVSFEHQTRFSRLHEHRVTVIAEVYRLLVIAERAFNQALVVYREGESHEAIRRRSEQDDESAANAGNAFSEYFQTNRVWFDEDLSSSIENLAGVFRDIWLQYTDPDPESPQERREARLGLQREVPRIRAEIEERMRVMLGALDSPVPAGTREEG